MYLPKHFEENDSAVLRELIGAHPLGTWVTTGDGGELVANHVPFLLDAERGDHGTLVAHVARANPVWKSLARGTESIVVFQGAHVYVSPSWYPSKQEHGKVVPTWNYAVVHVHGRPRAIEDRDWLLRLVTRLTQTHEAANAVPWQVSDAPADYIEQMLKAIVGIEIPITRIEGKWKVSQNRSQADQRGVIAGLEAHDDEASKAMAELIKARVGA